MQQANQVRSIRAATFALVLSAGLLAGCARQPVDIIVVAPPPPPAPLVMPKPPRGSAARLAIPAPLPDGSFATPNRNLSGAASIWHLRSGLNVAALQCGAASSDQYNRMLQTHKAALASAFSALEAEYRSGGGDWQDRFDDAMTRLYNYFAQPPAQRAFCDAAMPLLAEAATLTPEAFGTFARTAILGIDQPFTDFWREYHRYRVDLAAWQAKQPGGAPPMAAAVGAAPPATTATVRFAPSAPIVQQLPTTPQP